MSKLVRAVKLVKGFVIGVGVGLTAGLAVSDRQRRRLTEILGRVTARESNDG